MNVENLTYDHDEDGLWLILELDEEASTVEGVLRVRVQNVSEELYDRTKAAILPWLMERDEAKRTMPPAYDMREAYDVSDPKHPDWHSVHADIWDARAGK